MSDKFKGLLRVGSWIPVAIVHGIIIFLYFVYMDTFLLPLTLGYYQYDNPQVNSIFFQIINVDEKITNFLSVETSVARVRKGLILFLVIHVLIISLYYSLIKTMSNQPGGVPQQWKDEIQKDFDQYIVQEKQMITKWEEQKQILKAASNSKPSQFLQLPQEDAKTTPYPDHDDTSEVNFDDQPDVERGEVEFDDDFKLQLNIKAKIELLDKPGRRFCKRCLTMKPPRTHHCRQCQTCWLKMDHHCQFVNNCIGFGNYKFFLNLITYSSALLIIMILTYTKTFVNVTNDSDASDYFLVLVVLFYIFSWVLCFTIVVFLIFHLRLLFINQTTLEFMEKKKDSIQGNYSLGLIENIRAVLGRSYAIWFLPIFPNYLGDGTSF